MIIPIIVGLIALAILLLTAGIHIGRAAERSRTRSPGSSSWLVPTHEKNAEAFEEILTLHWAKPGGTHSVTWGAGSSLHASYVAEAALAKMSQLSPRPVAPYLEVPKVFSASARVEPAPDHLAGSPCGECERPYGWSHLGSCSQALVNGGLGGLVGFRLAQGAVAAGFDQLQSEAAAAFDAETERRAG